MKTLAELGSGSGWVAEVYGAHLGLAAGMAFVGFLDPRLLVFESRDECEAHILSLLWTPVTVGPVEHAWGVETP